MGNKLKFMLLYDKLLKSTFKLKFYSKSI